MLDAQGRDDPGDRWITKGTMGILALASGFLTWRTGKSQLPSGKHTKSY